MTRLVVRPEAEIDLFEAAVWYENERDGLGAEFLDATREAFHRNEEMPRVFPIIWETVRRAIIDRFPFGVFFTIDDDRSTVIAVLHLHREPASWKRRL